MAVMHEGSCLFIPRSDGSRIIIAEDMTLTEACEFMLHDVKTRIGLNGNSKAIVGLPVRKTLRKSVRRQSPTGWPKV